MFEVSILGSGDARQVPVWGCNCFACQRARKEAIWRRGPCSLEIKTKEGVTLIDAGKTDLIDRYAFAEINRIILTHFHMDHVQGLFHLRWSERPEKIPVFRPNDTRGSDDLYKHPGVLEFQPPFTPFVRQQLTDFYITPLPLCHSRPTLGYFIEHEARSFAYLTDTVDLPKDTLQFLQQCNLELIILDCTHPPTQHKPRNHNDINLVLSIHAKLNPQKMVLTHISHQLDCWLMQHAHSLPNTIVIAQDGMKLL